jgi:tRNA-dihydrouridine synthase B
MKSAESLSTTSPIVLGPLVLDGVAMLAPMSGVSDLAMRRIARRFGAALVFSEMVAAETYLDGDTEAALRAEGDGVFPHAVQLVGREPRALAETARRVEGAGAQIIDINMGCPARRVSGALAGAALMRDLDHAERIIASVVGAVSAPVTLKMRLAWDETSLNAPELARRAERAGAKMATVHGRTRREAAIEHLDWLVAKLGPRAGLRHARKHLAAYAEVAGAPARTQRELVTTEDPDLARKLLIMAFEPRPIKAAA